MTTDEKEMLDLLRRLFRPPTYYELKRNQKELKSIQKYLVEIMSSKANKRHKREMNRILKALKYTEEELAKFSVEERAIYDAIYGETT